MNNVYEYIPNYFFKEIVGPYSFFKGKAIATVDDLQTALINYSHWAAKQN